MSKVIAIMNEKGGCAKTTTATALAYLLAKQGKKTALIDYDGQANASLLMGVRNPLTLQVTVSNLLNCIIQEEQLPEPKTYIIKTDCGVDLIPANRKLASLERDLVSVNFREYILKQYVDTIRDNYDYVLIDCMPQMGTPMVNVLMCADSLIIPTQTEILSLQAVQELVKHYVKVKSKPFPFGNPKIEVEGILVTMDTQRTIVSAQMKDMIDGTFGGKLPIFDTCIPRSSKVAEAAMYGKTICEYMPRNKAALAYQNFAKELMKHE
ncbi:ParA family protein [Scatolibacter rhodanostii]|uniref:ParA family protein n=1 Tax=Scatolibacter rhodanostii TaxID=2014781 RepID=UPI000C08511D|nr:ParA family protein [Scatolibacter rhodanostii]